MKIRLLSGAILLSGALGFFAFRSVADGNITGKVTPADGAASVVAYSGSDSVKANIQAGAFTLSVKPGTYKVMIDAIDPYKDETIDNVQVADGTPVDLGEIKLKQ